MADFADFKRDKAYSMRENMEIDSAKKKFKEQNGDKRKLRSLRKKERSSRKEKRSGKKEKKKKKHKKHAKEEEATEGPELEEALKRFEKILEAKDKRFRGKTFKDGEKYHPKKPVSPFLPLMRKRELPPVWPAVHLINDKLKEFCTKHDNIVFFDATPIFASNEGGGKHKLHDELISPRGHPSELGFATWEGHIMGKLHKMIFPRGHPSELDKEDVEEDPEVENISPMTKGSDDGEGGEHVSDGKENEPPKRVEQPSRDDPAPPKEHADDEEEDDEEDGIEDKDDNGKENEPPKRVEQPSRDDPAPSKEHADDEEEDYEEDGIEDKDDNDDDDEE